MENKAVTIRIVGDKRDIKVLLTALKSYEKRKSISEPNRMTAQDLISLIEFQAKAILEKK